ncbi:MAG: hypothetical protein R3F34_06965 [Planctomycetota bacterium]
MRHARHSVLVCALLAPFVAVLPRAALGGATEPQDERLPLALERVREIASFTTEDGRYAVASDGTRVGLVDEEECGRRRLAER